MASPFERKLVILRKEHGVTVQYIYTTERLISDPWILDFESSNFKPFLGPQFSFSLAVLSKHTNNKRRNNRAPRTTSNPSIFSFYFISIGSSLRFSLTLSLGVFVSLVSIHFKEISGIVIWEASGDIFPPVLVGLFG